VFSTGNTRKRNETLDDYYYGVMGFADNFKTKLDSPE